MDKIEPQKKRLTFGFRVYFIFIIIASLASLFFTYSRYFANQRSSNQQVYDNLAVFDTRLQNLETTTVHHEDRIKGLEEAIQKLASASHAPAAAVASSPTVTVPATPESGVASSATNDARISELEKEIAALKAEVPMQNPENIGRSIRLLSAFHRFSDKVLSGKPFAAELIAFEELAKPDEASGSPLATFAPYADSGIPTFATLLATFDQAVDSLNTAQAIPPADAGFWERLQYNLTHLISVRRIDDAQTGNSETAIIGRAQAHLESEEIEAAITEIKSLPESARGNFSSWLDDAQMVTETPSLINQLEEDVMQKAFHVEVSTPEHIKPPEQSPSPQMPKL